MLNGKGTLPDESERHFLDNWHTKTMPCREVCPDAAKLKLKNGWDAPPSTTLTVNDMNTLAKLLQRLPKPTIVPEKDTDDISHWTHMQNPNVEYVAGWLVVEYAVNEVLAAIPDTSVSDTQLKSMIKVVVRQILPPQTMAKCIPEQDEETYEILLRCHPLPRRRLLQRFQVFKDMYLQRINHSKRRKIDIKRIYSGILPAILKWAPMRILRSRTTEYDTLEYLVQWKYRVNMPERPINSIWFVGREIDATWIDEEDTRGWGIPEEVEPILTAFQTNLGRRPGNVQQDDAAGPARRQRIQHRNLTLAREVTLDYNRQKLITDKRGHFSCITAKGISRIVDDSKTPPITILTANQARMRRLFSDDRQKIEQMKLWDATVQQQEHRKIALSNQLLDQLRIIYDCNCLVGLHPLLAPAAMEHVWNNFSNAQGWTDEKSTPRKFIIILDPKNNKIWLEFHRWALTKSKAQWIVLATQLSPSMKGRMEKLAIQQYALPKGTYILQQRNSWRSANSKVTKSDQPWYIWISKNSTAVWQQQNIVSALQKMILTRHGRAPSRIIPWEDIKYGPAAQYYDSDSILIATDGSVQNDGTMGAAATMWQDASPDKLVGIKGNASSTSAELVALKLAVSIIPEHTPKVTILSDSLSSISILNRRKIVDFQRFMEHQSQKKTIDQLIASINQKVQAGTMITIAKVKAHIGEFLNERADYLANLAALLPPEEELESNLEEEQCMIRISKDDQWHSWSTSFARLIRQRIAEMQMKKLIDSSMDKESLIIKDFSRATDWMLWKNASRQALGKAISKLPKGKKSRVVHQAISNIYPTQVNLHRWKPSERISKQCPIGCGAAAETFAHIQCICPKLQNSRIAAHHHIWKGILDNIASNYPHSDYILIREAILEDVITSLGELNNKNAQIRSAIGFLGVALDAARLPTRYDKEISESQLKRIRGCAVLQPSRKRHSSTDQDQRNVRGRQRQQQVETVSNFFPSLTTNLSALHQYHARYKPCPTQEVPSVQPPWAQDTPPINQVNISRQRPDAWLVDWKLQRIYILEFTRPYDYTRKATAVANIDKILKYTLLHQYIERTMPRDWSIYVVAFAVGVKGTADEPAWTAALDALGIDKKRHTMIREKAVAASLDSLLNILDVRSQLLRQQAEHLPPPPIPQL